jgi:hypothetical protein
MRLPARRARSSSYEQVKKLRHVDMGAKRCGGTGRSCGTYAHVCRRMLTYEVYEQVKKLRHVDMECKALRRHWALMREAVREELVWGPGKMQEVRDVC